MRLATRLMKLFGRSDLENDLRTEVEFHIQMRVESYVKDGRAPEEADALARRQFGDVEVVMNGMRQAHLRSTTAALIAVTSAAVIVAGLLVYRASSAIVFPPFLEFRSRRVKNGFRRRRRRLLRRGKSSSRR